MDDRKHYHVRFSDGSEKPDGSFARNVKELIDTVENYMERNQIDAEIVGIQEYTEKEEREEARKREEESKKRKAEEVKAYEEETKDWKTYDIRFSAYPNEPGIVKQPNKREARKEAIRYAKAWGFSPSIINIEEIEPGREKETLPIEEERTQKIEKLFDQLIDTVQDAAHPGLEKKRQEQRENESHFDGTSPDTTASAPDPVAPPIVTIEWSESNELKSGQILSLNEANALFARLDQNHSGGGYDKTAFSIQYMINGKSDTYEGRQDFGDRDGSLIQHIIAVHQANESWKDYVIQSEGLEVWEKEEKNRDDILNKLVPYFQFHISLSEIEKRADESLVKLHGLSELSEQDKADLAYCVAIKEYVSSCRQELNMAMGEPHFPGEPQKEEFDPVAHQEPIQAEAEQETDEYGLSTEQEADPNQVQMNLPGNSPINENVARLAKNMNSFYEYKEGSATAEYNQAVAEAKELAERQKKRVDPMYHEKIDQLVVSYAARLAANRNKSFAIDTRVASVMVAGAGNFPTRKKEKQIAAMEKNWNEFEEIQGILDKIRSTGMGGISADDPQAVSKLEKKLEGLETEQNRMKAVNAYYRKNKTLDGCPELIPGELEKIQSDMDRGLIKNQPYPSYALTNNSAEIRRLKQRIEKLTNRKETEYAGWEFPGGHLEANVESNRLRIFFTEKPSEEMRKELKLNGFKWSPKANAWQRQLTDNAYRSVKKISGLEPISEKEIEPLPAEPETGSQDVLAEENTLGTEEQQASVQNIPEEQKTALPAKETTSLSSADQKKGGNDMRYTQAEYQAAAGVNLLEYLQAKGYPLQRSGKEWELKDHDSFKISADGKSWYWHSKDVGRQSPILAIKELEGLNTIQAIKALAKFANGNSLERETSAVAPVTSSGKEQKPTARTNQTAKTDRQNNQAKEFLLPEKNENNDRALAYLKQERGLDEEIVSLFMELGMIYESKPYHNVVFIGEDQNRVARYATQRGTYHPANGKSFRGDVTGSQKEFPFLVEGNEGILAIYESPIDALSDATLAKLEGRNWQNKVYLSLAGMSTKGMEQYLKNHPNVHEIEIHLDNDVNGKDANGKPSNHGQIKAVQLKEQYEKEGYKVAVITPKNKDVNLDLLERRKELGLEITASTQPQASTATPPPMSTFSEAISEKVDSNLEKLREGVQGVYQSEHYLSFLRIMSKFTSYSARNMLLIAMQKIGATHVAGAGKWKKEFGRFVKKGEEAIWITAPVYKEKTETVIEKNEKGEEVRKEKKQVDLDHFRSIPVFDVSQTDGRPLPQLTEELQGEAQILPLALRVIEKRVPIFYEKLQSEMKGYFSPKENRIVLKKDMSDAQTFKTLIHEYAHSQLHTGDQTKSKESAEKEMEAESVAFIVAEHFNVDTSEYSFPYIADWASEKTPDDLIQITDQIKTTAIDFIKQIEKELEKERQQEQEKGIPISKENAELAMQSGVDIFQKNADGELVQVTDKTELDTVSSPKAIQIKQKDLQDCQERCPMVYERYLMHLFQKGFAKDPVLTLEVFGQSVKDSRLNRILLEKDPIIRETLNKSLNVDSCIKGIKKELKAANGIKSEVLVQHHSTGKFYTLTDAENIQEDTEVDLYVKMENGQYQHGIRKKENDESLSKIICEMLPQEVATICEKTIAAGADPSLQKAGQEEKEVRNAVSRERTICEENRTI